MKDIYIYPAIFSYANDNDDNDDILVEFPNLDGTLTFGNTPKEAHYKAKNYLESYLYMLEKYARALPIPPKRNDIKLKEDQAIEMIKVNLNLIRNEINNKVG
ncbi:MAG: type II toxin-antitoxin system HicB family antitoxin [Psychrilyobacter sp.]|uniref:type II toxin-antitoxin system HicB family antitoxin n=1 Tax=Psychrilyobacter sp. TaxID=2586924 RepID=UPI003C746277